MTLTDWIDTEIDHVCPDCDHETNIRAMGGPGVKLTCGDYDCPCYPSCTVLPQEDYTVEKTNWVLPNGTTVGYQCPECGGAEIDRNAYDDGCGYYDVKLVCTECSAHTWE